MPKSRAPPKHAREVALIRRPSSANEPIEPGLKLFRPHLERARLHTDAGFPPPHLGTEGAVGKEEAFAEIDIEDVDVVYEPGDRGGVLLRQRPPRLTTQPPARNRGRDQNLGLRLARTDLREDGGEALQKIGEAGAAGNAVVAWAEYL